MEQTLIVRINHLQHLVRNRLLLLLLQAYLGLITPSPSPSPTPTPAPSPSPSPSPSPTSTPIPNALLDALLRQSIVANPTPDCVVGGVGLEPDCKNFAQFAQTCSDVPGPEGTFTTECIVDRNTCAEGYEPLPIQGSCRLIATPNPLLDALRLQEGTHDSPHLHLLVHLLVHLHLHLHLLAPSPTPTQAQIDEANLAVYRSPGWWR